MSIAQGQARGIRKRSEPATLLRRLTEIHLSPMLSAGGSCSWAKVFSARKSCLAWVGFVMVVPRRKKYRTWNPEAYAHQALSPADRLPEDDLVFFLLDVVPQLDLDAFYESYELETRGQPPFDPTMLVCLLLYSYCVGVYSSRKIAQACERNLAFLAIVGDDRPDFRTISDFRKEHLELLAGLFVQVLKLAAQAGMVRLGNLAFDGSKFTGQASRHKAMSYGYMLKEEERLKAEIEALLKQAGKTDSEEDALHGSPGHRKWASRNVPFQLFSALFANCHRVIQERTPCQDRQPRS